MGPGGEGWGDTGVVSGAQSDLRVRVPASPTVGRLHVADAPLTRRAPNRPLGVPSVTDLSTGVDRRPDTHF